MSDIICACNQISKEDIEKAIADGAKTVEEVGEATSAGTGCGSCQFTIEELINKLNK